MNFVSLFAGVGGFDLAFERVGTDCVGQVEIDAKCREVLHKHWPHVPKWSDIKEVDGGWLGPVDVLAGGFPCQDYSVAGKRGGLAGDRGALWWQFHRLIAECRPRWVVGENVPGLLSSNGGRDFGAIVGSLVELGYGVVWRVLDAQYFGVAQRRRRVFIVGHIGGIPRPEVLAFAEGCSGDTPPRRQAGAFAAGELARSLGGVGGGQDYGANKGTLIAGTVSAKWAKGSGGPSGDEAQNLVAFAPEVASTLQSAIRGVPSTEQADGQLIVERPRHFGIQSGEVGVVGVVLNGSAEHPLDEGEFGGGEGHSKSFRLTDDDHTKPAQVVKAFNPYRTMTGPGEYVEGFKPDEVHDALTANPPPKGPPLVVAPSVRRLTPLECERLQGFPDDWTAGQSDTQRYRQMGNAVAVPVVEWIGKQLVKAE